MKKKWALLRRLGHYNLTEFQKMVLIQTSKIPRGETRTYKQIASYIKHPNSYRAVGTALRKNPLPITIPCHRVVRSDGDVGNYSSGGRARKLTLLREEHALS